MSRDLSDRACLRRQRRAMVAALIASLAGGSLNARAQQTPHRRDRQTNVLFLLTDDQRADSIHALGGEAAHTPYLDSLVREGVAFMGAITACPLCVPSRVEIFSGSASFGRPASWNGALQAGQIPWPMAMRDAGYETWHVGKWHLAGRPSSLGFVESQALFASGGAASVERRDHAGRLATGYVGWTFQDDAGRRLPGTPEGLTPEISEKFADAAIDFIRRRPRKPFFLNVNFTAPHDPLLVPPGFETRFSPARVPVPTNFLAEHPFDHGNRDGRDELLFQRPRTIDEVRREMAVYWAVVAHLDRQIGRILAALDETGQAHETIVIFASDQGVALGSHGLRGKQNMYQHTIATPLLLRIPRGPRGRRLDMSCYLRDVYPTICELTGVPTPASVEAKSLAPLIRGENAAVRPAVYGYFANSQRMVRTEGWKLISYPKIGRVQLFDLIHDPFELQDLSNDPNARPRREQLATMVQQWERAAPGAEP